MHPRTLSEYTRALALEKLFQEATRLKENTNILETVSGGDACTTSLRKTNTDK